MTEPHQQRVHGVGGGRRARAVIWLPGLAVALGAAVATAHGLFEVALAAGVPAGIAWLYPLITDGLALVAYTATARLHRRGARYAWAVVVLAAGLSGLAQAAYLAGGATLDASPALRFGVGAWPAVAAAVVAHLLYLLADSDRPAPAETVALAVGPSAATTGTPHPAPAVEPDPGLDPVGPPSPAPEAVEPAARPIVQPAIEPAVQSDVYSPPVVHPDPYTPMYDATTAALSGPTTRQPPAHRAPAVEHLDGPVEHPVNTTGGPPPRERARAAAAGHAARHGVLPTVSELAALAAVSRGTAAAALKALREHPTPLHLVADTPDAETQQ